MIWKVLNMQKITNLFYRFSQGMTLGIGGCLLLMSCLAMIVYGIMYGNDHYGIMTFALLLMAAVATGGVLILGRKLEKEVVTEVFFCLVCLFVFRFSFWYLFLILWRSVILPEFRMRHY